MKTQVDSKKLRETLGLVAKLAGTKSTMPVLGCVLFDMDAKAGRIHLTATNVDMWVSSSFAAEVSENASFCVSSKMLTQVVGALAGDELTLETITGKIRIASGPSNFRLFTISAEEFPKMQPVIAAREMVFSQADLLARINSVQAAQSSDTTRYILNGIFIDRRDDGTLYFVATDGRRLHNNKSESVKGATASLILPAAAVSKLTSLLKFEGHVAVKLDEKKVEFCIERTEGQIVFTSKVVEGRFPDWAKVIPSFTENTFEVNREALAGAIRRMAMICSEKANSVALTIEHEKITMRASSPDLGESSDEVSIVNSRKIAGGFACNPDFLLAALDGAAAETIKVAVNPHDSSVSPLVISCDSLQAIIMPVRVS